MNKNLSFLKLHLLFLNSILEYRELDVVMALRNQLHIGPHGISVGSRNGY